MSKESRINHPANISIATTSWKEAIMLIFEVAKKYLTYVEIQ